MARSTLIYEATVRLWRMGDTVNPLARLKVLGPLLRPIFRPEENQAIIIPVRESVDDGRSASLPVEILAAFIAQAEHIAVLSHCICRQSLGCDTHDARLGCMFLGEGAARIDRSLGRQVDRTEAIAHVQRAVDARLTPTVLHSVVDAILLQIPFRRMLAVCFCCDCCCTIRRGMRLGPQALAETVVRLPGLRMSVGENCTGCGECQDVCDVSAIRVADGKAWIAETCKGCGRCQSVCPQQAIDMHLQPVPAVQRGLLELMQRRTTFI